MCLPYWTNYNNVKVLDTLNKELFQLQIGEKETVLDWGVHLSRHLQVLVASFPEHFPLDCMARLKCDCFYGGLPKRLKAMVAYLKASPDEKTYSDHLWATREAKKEVIGTIPEPNNRQYSQAQSHKFFPLWKLKGTQPPVKTPAVHLVHLKEENTEKEEEDESKDPDGIKGVMEEFMVHLVRVVKDAQQEENYCYNCSSLEHFIHDCPLVKVLRADSHLNCREGTVPEKGAQTPRMKVTTLKEPWKGCSRHRASHTVSLLESQSLPVMVWGQKCSQGKG